MNKVRRGQPGPTSINTLSRRAFVRWTGGAALAGAMAGCNVFITAGLGAPPALDSTPWRAPEAETRDPMSHAIARLSFGPRPGDYARVADLGVAGYIEEQLAPECIDDAVCETLLRRLESLTQPAGELFEYKPEILLNDLTKAKILRAVYSRRQLYEVMVDFWSDHFNIDASKGDCRWLTAADNRDVIRKHALGRFPELARASALSPAMLWYLDGRLNRVVRPGDRPNENYARELLELHTLGIDGGYTQRDVMAIARSLTGWTVRSKRFLNNGAVEFDRANHDDGEKMALGRTLPAGLQEHEVDEVLTLVTRHPATARHIAGKLCRRFIGERPSDAVVDAVAETFTQTEGDIKATLRVLFRSEAFRDAGESKIKRPFHFVASALRATAATTDAGASVQDYLARMGHLPFQYPTPDGYPEDALPWMGSLMWRWHFARALADGQIAGTRVDWQALNAGFNGAENWFTAALGRKPRADERRLLLTAAPDPGAPLASPGFQRY